MNKVFEELELLKNKALSDLDSIPKNAIPICEKSNEEVMKAYEALKQTITELKQIKESNSSEALIFYIDQMIRRNNKFIAKDKGIPQLYIDDNEVLKQIKQTLLNKSKKEELLDELLKTKIRPCYMLNSDKLYKIDESLIVPDDKIYNLLEEVYKEGKNK